MSTIKFTWVVDNIYLFCMHTFLCDRKLNVSVIVGLLMMVQYVSQINSLLHYCRENSLLLWFWLCVKAVGYIVNFSILFWPLYRPECFTEHYYKFKTFFKYHYLCSAIMYFLRVQISSSGANRSSSICLKSCLNS